MEVVFTGDLKRLYEDARYTSGFGPAVVKAYRKWVGIIRNAQDERTIRSFKSSNFKKYPNGEFSIRLNDQWRLFATFETVGDARTATLLGIRDPH